MPRPCPRCARPVPDTRKTCLYCGAEPPPPGETLPRSGAAPEPLDSIQAVTRLLEAAHAAMARGDEAAAALSMGRIFLEVHSQDLSKVLATMTEGWLKGMVVLAGPARLGRSSVSCQHATAAALEKHWEEASLHFSEARVVYADIAMVNPTMEILALGAQYAGEQTALIQERESRLEELVHRATRLLTIPGRKAESMPLFRQALTILAEDPDRPQNQERADRIRQFITDFERTGETDFEGPASQLPPRAALEPQGWDDLGMQIMPQHPQQAKICFERAALGQPNNGRFWLHLAMCLMTVDAPDQDIISAFGQAVMRDPGELKAWVGLASALQEGARFSEAEAAWDEALKLAPDADAPQRQRAFCLAAQQLLDQGGAWDAKAWHEEGRRRVDTEEWNLADFAFSRALALAPVYPGALMGKGLANFQWASALKEEGNPASFLRFRMAADSLAQALALRPEQAGLASLLEQCHTELKGPR